MLVCDVALDGSTPAIGDASKFLCLHYHYTNLQTTDSVPHAFLKSTSKHQRSNPNLASTINSSPLACSAPEKPLPSIPALNLAHMAKFSDGPDVIPCLTHAGGLKYEQDALDAEEDCLNAPAEHFPHGLDEW